MKKQLNFNKNFFTLSNLILNRHDNNPRILSPGEHEALHRIASLNNVLIPYLNNLLSKDHSMSQQTREFFVSLQNSYKENEHNRQKLLKEALDLFSAKEIKAFVMKSFLTYPFFDNDIDLVVVDPMYNESRKILGKERFFFRPNLSNLREPDKHFYEKKKYNVFIHLHSEVSWNGIICLDKYTVWERRKEKNIEGVKFYIPSNEDEILIAAAHSIFENYYITFGDLLYVSDLITKTTDWEYIFNMAQKYNWRQGLILYLQTLKNLAKIFKFDVIIPDLGFKHDLNDCIMPYYYSYSQLIKTYFQKITKDILDCKLKTIPRQLFSYTLVGYFWLYRRKKKKCQQTALF